MRQQLKEGVHQALGRGAHHLLVGEGGEQAVSKGRLVAMLCCATRFTPKLCRCQPASPPRGPTLSTASARPSCACTSAANDCWPAASRSPARASSHSAPLTTSTSSRICGVEWRVVWPGWLGARGEGREHTPTRSLPRRFPNAPATAATLPRPPRAPHAPAGSRRRRSCGSGRPRPAGAAQRSVAACRTGSGRGWGAWRGPGARPHPAARAAAPQHTRSGRPPARRVGWGWGPKRPNSDQLKGCCFNCCSTQALGSSPRAGLHLLSPGPPAQRA